MSFKNFLVQLTEIQFQADKILKSIHFDEPTIKRFAEYSKELKIDLLKLELNDELQTCVSDIEEIDLNFHPEAEELPSVKRGFFKNGNGDSANLREDYLVQCVKSIRERFSHVNNLLKEY